MRLLAVLLSYPPRRRNGAFITTHAFLAELAARGHQVDVVHTGGGHWTLDGIKVHSWSSRARLLRTRPDVVLNHHGFDSGTVPAAVKNGAKHVLLVHGESGHKRLGTPDLVWFGTDATRRFYRWTGPRLIVPPPIDPDSYRTSPGSMVTLVGLSAGKGVDIFHRIARRLPRHKFLGVFGAYDRQRRLHLPNVTYLRNQPDMRDVYRRTRVLLMPSSTETFGRVGLEAMCSGIPVVAHPTAGMREAFGDAATFHHRGDVSGWVRTVGMLMRNQGAWDAASGKARSRAARLDYRADVNRFADAVENTAGRAGTRPQPQGAPQFAVTGAGRSGTAYMRAILQTCGLKVGHEEWFNPIGTRVPNMHGDVSWLAVPAIEQGAWAGPSVLVTRHPIANIRALVGAYFLTHPTSPYTQFALDSEPELRGIDDIVVRAVEWWARWNTRAATVADLTVRIEDLPNPGTLARVADVVGYPLDPAKAAQVPTNVHHGGRADIRAEMIWSLLDGRADPFGYRP